MLLITFDNRRRNFNKIVRRLFDDAESMATALDDFCITCTRIIKKQSVKENHETERRRECYRVLIFIQYYDSIIHPVKERFENENNIAFLLRQKIVEKSEKKIFFGSIGNVLNFYKIDNL